MIVKTGTASVKIYVVVVMYSVPLKKMHRNYGDRIDQHTRISVLNWLLQHTYKCLCSKNTSRSKQRVSESGSVQLL